MTVALLISLRMSLTVSLLVLIFISGVVAQDGWAVHYNPKYICALNGSTVTMKCMYRYLVIDSSQNSFWSTIRSSDEDLLNDPYYRDRVQYHGDQQQSTLRLMNVTEKDQSTYHCRYKDDRFRGRYRDRGVDLSVTDLQVEVPERVIEGDKVTLTCKTTCSLTVQPTFTWYRNGRYLSSSTDQLHLQPVSRKDAGRYRCAVLGQDLRSPEVTLNVRYGPKSISVSISPSGKIVEGSSVTLTCSSDANPPVEYNWIKGTTIVGKGKTYTMKEISSVDSGQYKCRSSNEHGEKLSEALTLNVLYLQVEVPERVIEGDNVTLTCKTTCSLTVTPTFTWYRNGRSLSSSTDQLHLQPVSREDADRYRCGVLGLTSPEVILNVRYGPKSVSVSISPSGEIVEGSSVNLTCSSDANPPVQNYNWFKGTSLVGKGETYTMKKISSVDSGEYKCKSSNEHGVKYSTALSLDVLCECLCLCSPTGRILTLIKTIQSLEDHSHILLN
uniref:Ig-like domain-containing protein n=1 Tax=Pygocentrus nattereri TaxID=42514 RepID=A0AAR2M6B8_PYGNA